MHHERAHGDFEGTVTKSELLDHAGLKVDLETPAAGAGFGACELTRAGIDADDATACAESLLGKQRKCSGATADVENPIAGLQIRKLDRARLQLVQRAAERYLVEKPDDSRATAPCSPPACARSRTLRRPATVNSCQGGSAMRLRTSCDARA
jgi:hypothetical protein